MPLKPQHKSMFHNKSRIALPNEKPERFSHQDPPPTEEQTQFWKKSLAQRVEEIRYCHRLDLGETIFIVLIRLI